MRQSLFMLVFIILLQACASKEENNTPTNIVTKDTVGNFFPVTTFLKGQIFEIKNGGTTPVRKIIINKKTDSSWVKMEVLDSLLTEFLNPLIDTANLKETFAEKKFLDQTVNAFTFTYDPINVAKNNFAFKHWDVYVDPDNQKVKRIYLLKKINATTDMQLTWLADKWCKMITIETVNGKATISKEESFTWKFE
jgi:hypothetical protein